MTDASLIAAPFSRRTALAGLALGLVAAATLSACKKKEVVSATDAQAAAASLARGRTFMATNAKQPGVVSRPSGLQYKIVHSGPADGPHPSGSDEIKVHYEGKLLDDTVFDSTLAQGAPAILELNTLVAGWKEALPLMRPGDEWILYVPPELGYGERGAGGAIPPNATLIFRMQLLGVLSHGGALG
jgi:FKBP-type peptidyl-prolyl cis-trans isomerase